MFSPPQVVLLFIAFALLSGSVPADGDLPSSTPPEYTADGELRLPENYRAWIYLSSDFHPASPSTEKQKSGHDRFLNVFVNPQAYEAFLHDGTWPDKTMLVVESREAESISMNNQTGQVQGLVGGIAVHVKDEARFAGRWAFFGFHGEKTSRMIPLTASCYTCHSGQGAVDTTFVQFYPTLFPVAKSRGTLSTSYAKSLESPTPTAQ
jgi:Cytochrome P460